MVVSFSIVRGIAWLEGRSDPKKKSHQKIVLLLFFLVVGDYIDIDIDEFGVAIIVGSLLPFILVLSVYQKIIAGKNTNRDRLR